MNNKNFNIYDFLAKRPLSYSALNAFTDPKYGSPEKWYKNYILGERQSSPQLDFGTYVDKRIQNDPTFLPTLPRYEHMQYKLNVMFNKKIPLVGLPDGLNLTKTKELADYKTAGEKSLWTQKKADETEQITFYLLLLYITHKIKPEDFTCYIHCIPTKKEESGDFKTTISLVGNEIMTFKTKRSMQDILKLGAKINKTIAEMEKYVQNHD